ncbi:50S ribosomal protein L20 [Fontivita pretiosa]|uniref:50S ribosomal protein L20 n=1 Tax=Fontivita pretiosa TaxID=2989684 RepID=UPI003D174845
MPRVKGGPSHARKRKRILRRASGFVGQPGKNYRSALEFTRKADVYAYEHRHQKKRFFRQLWITRLGAALRQRGISYNRFIPALVSAGIELNRKMLSEIAISDPATFDAIVEQVRPHIRTA